MKKLFLFPALISLLLVGCGTRTVNPPETPQNVHEKIEKKQIITSFYPLAFMTEQIVGNKAEVVNLSGSKDVHEYEPSPQDMVKLSNADLVVFQGAELEPWADGIIPELEKKGVKTLEVAHHLELMKMDTHNEHEEDHDDNDKHEEASQDEHHHGEFNPHTWLDPVLAQKMVDEILQAVVEIDPTNKVLYETNAQKLNNRFVSLDKNFQSTLQKCSNHEVIVSHNAYGYLANRYDFEIHAIAGISTQDEPSAKILAALKEETNKGMTHILVEANNIRQFADTLATETGLKTLSINPLGRGTLDANKDFFEVMNENLSHFKTALNCQS